MSTDAPRPASPAPKATGPAASDAPKPHDRIIIRSYPKVFFFYPTALVALVCFIASYVGFAVHVPDPSDSKHFDALAAAIKTAETPVGQQLQNFSASLRDSQQNSGRLVRGAFGNIFLIVMAFNILVFAFEFDRIKSIAIFIAIVAIVFLLLFLNSTFEIWTGLKDFLGKINVVCNAQFYLFVVLLGIVVSIIVMITVRLDYWELKHNELLHHRGFLGDVERFPSQNLRITKEITDVFEWLLGRAGRLIIIPRGENRAIVLDNVLKVNTRERDIQRLLQVQAVKISAGGPLEDTDGF